MSPAAVVCPDDSVLQEYLRERLSAEDVGRVDTHIVGCSSCLVRLEQLVESHWIAEASTLKSILESAPESPGELPGYELLDRIAAGGMGVVWRARDVALNRRLAIKVMKPAASDDAGQRERFLREAQICGQLAHPSIVPVHAVGTLADGRPFYTMKLVEGETLAPILRRANGSNDAFPELLQIFEQVCQAVAFAHRKGVVHRDLKPHNVMAGRHGEVQVMDWGLAKVLSEPEPPHAGNGRDSVVKTGTNGPPFDTTVGDVIGTLSYMPPEQARGLIAEVDLRSDVFSLGAILCEILTGAPPYVGASLKELHRKAANAELEPALDRLRRCAAGPDLIDLAIRCLAVDPTGRPSDGGAVAAAVANHRLGVERQLQEERVAREGERVEAVESAKRLTLEARWERRRRRLALCLAGTVAVLLAFSAVAAVYVNHQQSARQQTRRLAEESLKGADRALRGDDFAAADVELERTAALLRDGPADLRKEHDQLAAALDFARRLEAVRLEYFTWSNGWFDCYTALDRYAKEFQETGWDAALSDVEVAAKRVAQSPVHARIVAALDDWAWLAHREAARAADPAKRDAYSHQRDRLLRVARRADPDPRLKDRLRDGAHWDDPQWMAQFADGIAPASESPELLVLVGKLLAPDRQRDFWARCQADHPGDFWLNVELGRLHLARATADIPGEEPYGSQPVAKAFAAANAPPESVAWARQAIGYYRAALTRHPNRIGVHLDLAAALVVSGDLDEATRVCRAAARIAPGPTAQPHEVAEARLQLGLAQARRGNLAQALGEFQDALKTDSSCSIARWNLAVTLQKLDRDHEAAPLFEELLRTEPDDTARAVVQQRLDRALEE